MGFNQHKDYAPIKNHPIEGLGGIVLAIVGGIFIWQSFEHEQGAFMVGGVGLIVSALALIAMSGDKCKRGRFRNDGH